MFFASLYIFVRYINQFIYYIVKTIELYSFGFINKSEPDLNSFHSIS